MFRRFRYFCCNAAEVIDLSSSCQETMLEDEPSAENLNDSQYKILTLLGSGATSHVYKIKDINNGKLYVCKKMSLQKKRRAYREVKVLKKLNSDLFPTFRNFFVENNKIHILVDYVNGIELFEVIHASLENNLITKKCAIKYISYMGKCIKTLHDVGFVHLDIKLENFILIHKDPLRLKLIDFGTAHPYTEKLSKIDLTVGTRGYTSMELYRGNYNNKCDVWSLGVCLWILLTSTAPFNHKNVPRRCQEEDFPFHDFYFPNAGHISRQDEIGDNLFNLIKNMLSPFPSNRFNINDVLTNDSMILR
jgi:calcium-dependent protein kinase